MKYIKKISATPLPKNKGMIIDSFDTSDDKHKNAPSLNAVKQYINNNCKVNGDFAVLTGSCNIEPGEVKSIDYPNGFNKNNCVILTFNMFYNGGTSRIIHYVEYESFAVMLRDCIELLNKIQYSKSITYKIILMKIG